MPDMRFAPPSALRSPNRSGLNQTHVRTHNERTLLSLLRQHDGLSRVEIGQLSGLSAQAVSVIVRALEEDGLCVSGPTQKGRIGPPSTPMKINPDGAFSIGIHLGRKAADVLLVNFIGEIQESQTIAYGDAGQAGVLAEIFIAVSELTDTLSKAHSKRVVGIGLAVPLDIDDWWTELLSPPFHNRTEELDLERLFEKETGFDIYVQNDISAAITGEVLFGAAKRIDNFGYLFIGHQSELRLVLNHRILERPDAGIKADLPTVSGLDAQSLGEMSNLEPGDIDLNDLKSDQDVVAKWISNGARKISDQLRNLTQFIHLDKVILDGRTAKTIQIRLADEINHTAMAKNASKGTIPQIGVGGTGLNSKAFGAACLPVYARYMLKEISAT